MNVLQPYYRNIPEQKDEKEEDQTGKNQKPDKNSLLGFNLHVFSSLIWSNQIGVISSESGLNNLYFKSPNSKPPACGRQANS
jgi:hypothetical protein